MLKLFTIVSCFFCLTALGQNRNEIKINIPEFEKALKAESAFQQEVLGPLGEMVVSVTMPVKTPPC